MKTHMQKVIERASQAEEILVRSSGGWEEGYFERCCSIHTASRRWIATGRWLRGRWQHLPLVGPQVPQDLQETESFLPSFTLPVSSPSSQRHSQHLHKPPFSFAWAPLPCTPSLSAQRFIISFLWLKENCWPQEQPATWLLGRIKVTRWKGVCVICSPWREGTGKG